MAGINDAGPNGWEEAAAAKAGGGLLSAQARVQYAALAALRWHMFINGLRSKMGAFELGARTVALVFYAAMGLGLGAGAGAVAYLLASREQWQFLPIVFWVVCLIWQMVPVAMASFQDQFDLGILLRFPVGFRPYFLLYVVFGLSDVSTILGGLCCLGIWVGITMARPELSAWTALALAVFASFNISLVRAVFAWIDRWLAQRKTREILGGVFMILALSLQLFNPAFRQQKHHGKMGHDDPEESYRKLMAEPWLKTANAVQKWLPPGLVGVALRRAAEQQPAPALGSLGVLGLYVLAAGGVLAVRLRAEYRGESLGAAPKRKAASVSRTKAARGKAGWLLGGSGPIAAVMENELRTLLRSLPLLYSIGAPLLLVLVFSGVFNRSTPQSHMFRLALPLCMVYAQLGFMRLFFNNMGTEGAGIQLYFLSPTPIRTVLLAKNLFHSLLFGLATLMAGILATLRLGRPEGVVLAATVAWLLFALPCNFAAGNVFSLTMPYRVNPGRISRQRGSQSNSLLSLLVQLLVLGVGAAVFALCSIGDNLWLAVPVFLALAGAAGFVWMRMLRNSDALANSRRDSLIATLMKTE
jgi:ABC-2 type transport system permease protein